MRTRRAGARATAIIAVAALASGAVAASAPSSASPLSPHQDPVGTAWSIGGLTASSSPHDIAAGRDGALWFTEFGGDRIGRITTAGAVTEFSAGIPAGSAPAGITAGPDGALWFTEAQRGKIGRITTSGAVTHFPAGAATLATPWKIAVGPDRNLWFTEVLADRIGRLTPAGVLTEFSAGITPGSQPDGITAGPDGALWFTEAIGDRIGRITTNGAVDEFNVLVAGSNPDDIALGSDDALWVTLPGKNRIGRLSASGLFTSYGTGITAGSGLRDIAPGPDGALWFTEGGGDRIGRIATNGIITEYPASAFANIRPWGITAGPDGSMWVAETSANWIGVITTGVPGAPVAPVAMRGASSVQVVWSPPSYIGASAPSRYTVTATPGGATCVTSATSCEVAGLTNGTAYRFSVRATNGSGTGAASPLSDPSTPVAPPGPPRTPAASPLDHAAVITWRAPAAGSPPGSMADASGYWVASVPAGHFCYAAPPKLTCTVTGLPNTAFRFTVTASSDVGPGTPAITATLLVGSPSAPRAVAAAFPVARKARVSWKAPASPGSGPVKAYQVRWSTTGARAWTRWVTTGLVRAAVRAGLVPGRRYQVQVRALNATGAGPAATLRFRVPR